MVLDFLKVILDFMEKYHNSLTLIIGAIGGTLALYRYFKSERQAQAKTAAEFIRNFSENENNKTVMHFLDYWTGSMRVTNEGKAIDIQCNEDFIIKALRSGYRRFDQELTLQEKLVRKALDHFLTDLEMFDALIDGKVINEKDFGSYFSYWVKRIGYPPRSINKQPNLISPLLRDEAFRNVIWNYIYSYEFRRVPRLIERVYYFAMTQNHS